MKKILSIVILLLMCLGSTSCKKDTRDNVLCWGETVSNEKYVLNYRKCEIKDSCIYILIDMSIVDKNINKIQKIQCSNDEKPISININGVIIYDESNISLESDNITINLCYSLNALHNNLSILFPNAEYVKLAISEKTNFGNIDDLIYIGELYKDNDLCLKYDDFGKVDEKIYTVIELEIYNKEKINSIEKLHITDNLGIYKLLFDDEEVVNYNGIPLLKDKYVVKIYYEEEASMNTCLDIYIANHEKLRVFISNNRREKSK